MIKPTYNWVNNTDLEIMQVHILVSLGILFSTKELGLWRDSKQWSKLKQVSHASGPKEMAQKVIELLLKTLRPKTKYQVTNPNPEAGLYMSVAPRLEDRHRQIPRTP